MSRARVRAPFARGQAGVLGGEDVVSDVVDFAGVPCIADGAVVDVAERELAVDVAAAEDAASGNGHGYFIKSPWVSTHGESVLNLTPALTNA